MKSHNENASESNGQAKPEGLVPPSSRDPKVVLDKATAWAEEAAAAHGMTFIDLELSTDSNWTFQLFIESTDKDGVSLEQCRQVSRYLEAYLDAEPSIPEDYTLEVSSFGLERPLVKPSHFEYAKGSRIEFVLREAIDSKYRMSGQLVEVEDDRIHVDINGQRHEISLDNIKEAERKEQLNFKP